MNHKWDGDGEHCSVCGVPDWCADGECPGPKKPSSREHGDSPDCWHHPTLDYVSEDGAAVYVHHKPT